MRADIRGVVFQYYATLQAENQFALASGALSIRDPAKNDSLSVSLSEFAFGGDVIIEW